MWAVNSGYKTGRAAPKAGSPTSPGLLPDREAVTVPGAPLGWQGPGELGAHGTGGWKCGGAHLLGGFAETNSLQQWQVYGEVGRWLTKVFRSASLSP